MTTISIVVLLKFMLNFVMNLYDHIFNVLWEWKFETNIICMEYPKAFLWIPLYYNIMQHFWGHKNF
jgi:hypothetical protein